MVGFFVRPTTISMPAGIKQAGIVGTDFLSEYVFTLDYMNQWVYKSVEKGFPMDAELIADGFKPASSKGYYSNKYSNLINPETINSPVVAVKIGTVAAKALVDPGLDDYAYYHTVNINKAFYDQLVKANIKLIKMDRPA